MTAPKKEKASLDDRFVWHDMVGLKIDNSQAEGEPFDFSDFDFGDEDEPKDDE